MYIFKRLDKEKIKGNVIVKQHGCEFLNLELAGGKIPFWTHFHSIQGYNINWLSRLTISHLFCGAQVNGVAGVSQTGNCCLRIMWFFKFRTEKCGGKKLLKAKHF